MMLQRLLSLAVLPGALIAAPVLAQNVPQATLDSGIVAGAREGAVEVFKGIPYAAAPIGPLRWKAPQAAAAWTGVRAAKAFGTACPQGSEHKEPWAQVGPMGEDCLFLNVWRPAKPGKYPVMVWLHGGAFTYGAAGVPLYDGAALATRGVVIVTVNYRLGRLGFFAHPALTAEDPGAELGNYGIMDQIAALRWVKRNAAALGGDPGNVTIFGESAGAGTVQIMMGSPASKGLFHKAISESGSGSSVLFPIRGGPINAEMVGAAWAAGLGLKDATAAQLRAIPLADVVKNGRSFPFLDGKVVTRSPGAPFYDGTQMKVPLIIGANSNEASLGGMTEPAAKALLGDQFQSMLDGYLAETKKPRERAVVELAADVGFVLPSYALADKHAAAGAKAFAYFFDQVPVDLRGEWPGTIHGGEVEYMFGTKATEHRWDARDAAVSKLMGDYWVRFAKTGDPNGGGAPKWPAVSAQPTAMLYVGPTTKVTTLRPAQEKAKAAAMADSVRKWAMVPQP